MYNEYDNQYHYLNRIITPFIKNATPKVPWITLPQSKCGIFLPYFISSRNYYYCLTDFYNLLCGALLNVDDLFSYFVVMTLPYNCDNR